MKAYLIYGKWYCSNCAGDYAPESCCYNDGGDEADCPQHCALCSQPLNNPLTSEGVDYVLEYVRKTLAQPRTERQALAARGVAGDYYDGCAACAVVRDWAEQLRWYRLNERDKRIVNWFLDHSSTLPDTGD